MSDYSSFTLKKSVEIKREDEKEMYKSTSNKVGLDEIKNKLSLKVSIPGKEDTVMLSNTTKSEQYKKNSNKVSVEEKSKDDKNMIDISGKYYRNEENNKLLNEKNFYSPKTLICTNSNKFVASREVDTNVSNANHQCFNNPNYFFNPEITTKNVDPETPANLQRNLFFRTDNNPNTYHKSNSIYTGGYFIDSHYIESFPSINLNGNSTTIPQPKVERKVDPYNFHNNTSQNYINSPSMNYKIPNTNSMSYSFNNNQMNSKSNSPNIKYVSGVFVNPIPGNNSSSINYTYYCPPKTLSSININNKKGSIYKLSPNSIQNKDDNYDKTNSKKANN